jgi:peptide/nickel transport system substrate-binding protein
MRGLARRRWLIVAGIGLVLSNAKANEPIRGGTLNFLVKPEPPHLQGAISTADAVWQSTSKFHNGLLNYDLDLQPVPELAESWKISSDGHAITFHLRKGVKFHDGADFTSADVKFTMEQVIKKFHPRGRTVFAHLTEVTTPDPYTAVFNFDTPAPYAIYCFNASETPILPRHIYEGTDIQSNPNNSHPIGTGPFRFVEWKKGQYIIAARNEQYWDNGKPYLDKIVMRIIPDASARAIALEGGELDVGGPWPVPIAEQERLGGLKSLMLEKRGYGMISPMMWLEFNMRDPQFADLRVRQAFAFAINKELLADTVWYGSASVATGPIAKSSGFYTADVMQFPYDPKKARGLLDAAGLKAGANGVRVHITFDVAPYDDNYLRTGEFVRQQLKEIGVDAELRGQDTPTYFRRIWTDNDFRLNLYSLSNSPDPTIGVQRMYWSKNIIKGAPFTNGSGFSNPQVDALLEAAQTEIDPTKRKAIWYDFQRLAMTELPIIPLLQLDMTTILNRRVKNLVSGGLGIYDTFANVYLAG